MAKKKDLFDIDIEISLDQIIKIHNKDMKELLIWQRKSKRR